MFDNDRQKRSVGFGVNDCPLWLYKELTYQAKALYNNQYWSVILDWYRKAESYDMLVQQGMIVQDDPGSSHSYADEIENEKPVVKTMGKGE